MRFPIFWGVSCTVCLGISVFEQSVCRVYVYPSCVCFDFAPIDWSLNNTVFLLNGQRQQLCCGFAFSHQFLCVSSLQFHSGCWDGNKLQHFSKDHRLSVWHRQVCKEAATWTPIPCSVVKYVFLWFGWTELKDVIVTRKWKLNPDVTLVLGRGDSADP